MFYCWHWCQSLTVSSVVGAPWRCGVLTTLGGIAGNGLGRLFGREHASTPQSGAEAPPLLKRSLPRLYCCCCSFFQKKKSEELTLEKNVQLKLSLFLRRRVDHPKWVVDFLLETTHSRKQIMEIVEDFAETSYNNGKPWKSSGFSCEAKNLRNLQRFHRFFIFLYVFHFFFVSFFSFLHFSFFLLFSFCFFFFFFILFFFLSRPSRRQKPEKNRREILVAKMTFFFCENSIFSASVNRQKRLGKAHLRVTPLSSFCISFWIFPLKKT